MRDLAIAYGSSRQAKKWVNKTIKFDDLKERLKVTIRTPESAEEYAKMGKAQKDAAKDHASAPEVNRDSNGQQAEHIQWFGRQLRWETAVFAVSMRIISHLLLCCY